MPPALNPAPLTCRHPPACSGSPRQPRLTVRESMNFLDGEFTASRLIGIHRPSQAPSFVLPYRRPRRTRVLIR